MNVIVIRSIIELLTSRRMSVDMLQETEFKLDKSEFIVVRSASKTIVLTNDRCPPGLDQGFPLVNDLAFVKSTVYSHHECC